MIQFEEAISIFEENISKGKIIKVSIKDAFGFVLAEDIHSKINMPPFNQSAMDGYAFKHSGINKLNVLGEIKAGDPGLFDLSQLDAVRIFTGAKVPESADTVVMQEHVQSNNNSIELNILPEKGANVRPLGEQFKVKEAVLHKGNYLNEAAIGLLASLGINKLKVYSKPKVAILVTGTELVKPGKSLSEGKVYESNSITLISALKKLNIEKAKAFRVADSLKKTKEKIKSLLEKYDLILISGGISVGEYDFVKEALESNKVKEKFYKVAQKPGKPLWFGKKKNKFVLALPGNPASSLTCFYLYGLPFIRKWMGFENIHLPRKKIKLENQIQNKSGRLEFMKARIEDGNLKILNAQASSMLKSFAICNALVVVPQNPEQTKEGEFIEYIPLDHFDGSY